MDSEEQEGVDPLKKYRDCWDSFDKKTSGRIWVAKPEHIKIVDSIIEELDGFEHSYMPKGFIAVYEGELFDVIYGHKFEMKQSLLTQVCLSRKIWIVCVTGIREPY